MTTPQHLVRQADPGAAYRAQRAEIDAAIARTLASGWYVLGEEGRSFEREFAAWLGARFAIGCGNGTDALALALRAIGAGPGMTVVTVSHTAVATVAAIGLVGATPLLLDIEPETYTLDPAELAAVLDQPPPGLPPIGAVIAVHLYGQTAAMETIVTLCERHQVTLIEDCAQAHGARLHGRPAGRFGRLAAFSFYPTKNLGALGDGGMVTTDDADLAERLGALRQYGWRGPQIATEPGVNSRLDEIQAAILRLGLRHLDRRNARRQAIAAAYDMALGDGSIRPPPRRPGAEHVFHQYVIRLADRPRIQALLREAGIGTGIHYPVPVHLQPAYEGRIALGPAGCRVSAAVAAEILSLPIHPELDDAEVAQVCDGLRQLS